MQGTFFYLLPAFMALRDGNIFVFSNEWLDLFQASFLSAAIHVFNC